MAISNATTEEQDVSVISNELEDFAVASFGPEQADVKINSIGYAMFDYAGTMKNDPVIAVQALVSPIDGSNDGKDFTIEWTTGAKMADFAIVNDGGALKPIGTKKSLYVNSNWAYVFKSMRDAGMTVSLNGPDGIKSLAGLELTVRQIPQPPRDGIEQKNAKGYAQKFYTCLKIIALPGEAKKGVRKGASASPKASTPTTTNAPTQAPTQAQAKAITNSTNGNAASAAVLAHIQDILKDSAGSITIPDLKKSVFRALKTDGKPSNECQSGAQSITSDYLIDQSMEHDLGWEVNGDTLTLTT